MVEPSWPSHRLRSANQSRNPERDRPLSERPPTARDPRASRETRPVNVPDEVPYKDADERPRLISGPVTLPGRTCIRATKQDDRIASW